MAIIVLHAELYISSFFNTVEFIKLPRNSGILCCYLTNPRWRPKWIHNIFEYGFSFKVKIKYEIFDENGLLHLCLLLFHQFTKIG